jgi:hypothetical protein
MEPGETETTASNRDDESRAWTLVCIGVVLVVGVVAFAVFCWTIK